MRFHGTWRGGRRLLVTALSSCKSIGSSSLTQIRNVCQKWRKLMKNSFFLAKKSTIITKVRSFFQLAAYKRQKHLVICQDPGEKKTPYKEGDIDTTSTAVDSGAIAAHQTWAPIVDEGLITPQDLSLEDQQQGWKVQSEGPRDNDKSTDDSSSTTSTAVDSGALPAHQRQCTHTGQKGLITTKGPQKIAECNDHSSSKLIGEADTSIKQLKRKAISDEKPFTVQLQPTTKKNRRIPFKKNTVQRKAKKRDLLLSLPKTDLTPPNLMDIGMAEPRGDDVQASRGSPVVSRKRKTPSPEKSHSGTTSPSKRSVTEQDADSMEKDLRASSPDDMTPDSWRRLDTNNLNPEQLSILMSTGERGMLDDTIINQAQELLQSQFGEFDGLQPTAAVLVPGYAVLEKAVQIHYDEDRTHWLTTCYKNGKILVADSINNKRLSPSLRQQINNIYCLVLEEPLKHVEFLNVDQQKNTYDCGIFSIAFAYEFLAHDGEPTAVFHHHMMRNHLISCLQSGKITGFPKRR